MLPTPGMLSTMISPPISFANRWDDGQAQTGAAEAARGRSVGLFERGEDPFDLRLAHADAGVEHRKAQALTLGVKRGR